MDHRTAKSWTLTSTVGAGRVVSVRVRRTPMHRDYIFCVIFRCISMSLVMRA